MTLPKKVDKPLSFAVSVVLHAVMFMTAGLVFATPIEYAVEAGTGGIEVSLTAAPAQAVSAAAMAPEPALVEKLFQNQVEEEALPALATKPVEEKNPAPTVAATVADAPEKGDGSSSVPGKDATTFYSAGGAITEVQPNYLRNPAPAYPLVARQNGWYGLVILKVQVDKSGRAVNVEKESSSGHDVLDGAALKTVKSWRFRPAKMGGVPIESSVRIPIRFELENMKASGSRA